MKTIILINRHKIAANKKHKRNDPVISVNDYKRTRYCHAVSIIGPSVVKYSPDKPLKCGATTWLETHAEVVLDQQITVKPDTQEYRNLAYSMLAKTIHPMADVLVRNGECG